jgi:hypothetical protein
MVPIPDVGEGAPYLTPKELDSIASEAGRNFTEATSNAVRCADNKAGMGSQHIPIYRATLERVFRSEMEAANRVQSAARRAADATSAAEKARLDAAQGQADAKAVEAAELERQAAVNKLTEAREKLADARDYTATAQDLYLKAAMAGDAKQARLESQITWGELDFQAIQRRNAAQKVDPDFARLVLTDIVTERKADRRGEYFHITGVIRNNRAETATIPALRVAALDIGGWTLAAETARQSAGRRLKPNQSIAFTYDLRPAPQATEFVLVVFATDALPPPRLQVSQFEQCRSSP